MRHQVEAEHLGGVDAGPVGDMAEKRPGATAHAPHRVDVALRVEFDRLAVLGEMDGQLRHPQQRLVEPDQPVLDGIAGPYRQPAADTQFAVEP